MFQTSDVPKSCDLLHSRSDYTIIFMFFFILNRFQKYYNFIENKTHYI